jgi:hypothetical protein
MEAAHNADAMFKAGLFLQDDTLPRTQYWERFLHAVKASEAFSPAGADLLIPHEDTAIETNWPRYGNPHSAYVRGTSHDLADDGSFHRYFTRIVDAAKARPDQRFLYVNMHPFIRVPVMLREESNVLIADISLARSERDANPNTISMPASPIIAARSAQPGPRPVLASFQGVNSHPVRQALNALSDGKSIIVNFVDRARHVGKVDAIEQKSDRDYEQLLARSTFGFVPRGDALFSYRLLEVMSFGCIPIILSDEWVLPFDRTVPWEELSLHVNAEAIPGIPRILASMTRAEILTRQQKTLAAYQSHLSSLEQIVATMLHEAQVLCGPAVAGRPGR